MEQHTSPCASFDDVTTIVRDTFGFDTFRIGQEAVIRRLLDGQSVLAIFPTGGGKSLCYQAPALVLDGLTVVISPLIALMKDQLDFLQSRGVPAARLDSSLGREESIQVYDDLRSGRLRLLYISPERLSNERFLLVLRRQKIALLAVDEVHCISEWGHNFRPDYLRIAALARDLGVERVLGLTATATPQVAEDIADSFTIAPDDIIRGSFHRPNLTLHVTPAKWDERDVLLLDRLRSRPPGPTIVYVTLQRTAEEVAEVLSVRGFNARAYHAGMTTEKRTAVQDAFMASDDAVIVATIAFGMGVDKANIRYVYHYNLPKALENFSQEIGRAGRDGEPSICELFACPSDVALLENFVYGDTPEEGALESLTCHLLDKEDTFDVSIYDLSNEYDIRPLVVKTLLAYLELDGLIEPMGYFYNTVKFQPQRSSREMLERFDGERAAFLRQIFRCAKEGKTWFTLDVDQAMLQTDASRDRVMAALSFLEERGDMIVQNTGLRQAFRKKPAQMDREGIIERVAERFAEREEHDIGRIRDMLAYAESSSCLTRRLVAYFGETMEDCGHCGPCLDSDRSVVSLPYPSDRPVRLDDNELGQLRRIRRDHMDALETPRQIARFLCGINSPLTSRRRLAGHFLFGHFRSMPFHRVLQYAEDLLV